MLITCLRGGLRPDFSKCVFKGEREIAMYIHKDIYFSFYDIYDCKAEMMFNAQNYLVSHCKNVKLTRETLDARLKFFDVHKEALISKSLEDNNISMFFDSLEEDALRDIFAKEKFSCSVSIYVKGEEVPMEDIIKNEKLYGLISQFLDELGVCEIVSAKDLAEIRAGVFKVKPSKKGVVIGTISGAIVGFGAGFLTKKYFDKKGNINE